MTLCPVALAVGCRKCPIFAACPVKSVIGDYRPDEPAKEKPSTVKTGARPKNAR